MRMLFLGLFLWVATFSLLSCREETIPKPRGYFRIQLPEKNYREIEADCPFVFEVPDYSSLEEFSQKGGHPCWYNLEFRSFKATLHLSYQPAHEEIPELIRESADLAYKHAIKADAIEESIIYEPGKHKYGLVYSISGNAASPVQFYLTDSSAHFFRGSLYFNVVPNKDSLSPVLEFIRKDLDHLIKTFHWR